MNIDNALKELELNIKHQDIKSDKPQIIGYEYQKGCNVYLFIFPWRFFK